MLMGFSIFWAPCGYIGIYGLYRDNGKENGSYYLGLGLFPKGSMSDMLWAFQKLGGSFECPSRRIRLPLDLYGNSIHTPNCCNPDYTDPLKRYS